jgi:hypothetical protein
MNRGDLLYNTAIEQSKEQDDRRRHFDTMSTGVLAFSGALIGTLAFSNANLTLWGIIVGLMVIASFIGVAIATISSLWLREWHFQPPLDHLYKNIESGDYEDEALVIWTGKQIMNAIENNEKPLRSKALWLRIAYICLAIEIIALGIFMLFT